MSTEFSRFGLQQYPVLPLGEDSASHVYDPNAPQNPEDASAQKSALSELYKTAPVEPTPVPSEQQSPSVAEQRRIDQGVMDLLLDDRLNQEIMAYYTGRNMGSPQGATTIPELQSQTLSSAKPLASDSVIAANMIEHYGAERVARMQQLQDALGNVRIEYERALTAAANNPQSPGWQESTASYGNGEDRPGPTFNPAKFTEWYMQQDALPNRAFRELYGPITTRTAQSGGDSGNITSTLHLGYSSMTVSSFEVQRSDSISTVGCAIDTGQVQVISIASPPKLFDARAVSFDPLLGFVTPTANLVPETEWYDAVVPAVFAMVITAGIAGPLLPTAATFNGGLVGSFAAGAVQGAFSGAVSGILTGNVSGRGILMAALGSGVTAGLGTIGPVQSMRNLGGSLLSAGSAGEFAQRALSLTGNATLAGAISELTGGSFRHGFTQALADGLAGDVRGQIDKYVGGLLANEQIDGTTAQQLNHLSRLTASAIRAAADPANPQHAFAQEFLRTTLQEEILTPAAQQAASIRAQEANANKPATEQNVTPAERERVLMSFGLSPEQARAIARQDTGETLVSELANRILDAEPTLSHPVAAGLARAFLRDGDFTIFDFIADDMDVRSLTADYFQREFPGTSRARALELAAEYLSQTEPQLTVDIVGVGGSGPFFELQSTYDEFGNVISAELVQVTSGSALGTVANAVRNGLIALGELGYAGIHNQVVKIAGGLASIPFLAVGVDAAVSVQEQFRDRFGYVLTTPEAQRLVHTIQPYAEIIRDIYGLGREAAALQYGDAATTAAEVALQSAVEIIGLTGTGRALTAYAERLPVGDPLRTHLLASADDYRIVFDSPGSTILGADRIGARLELKPSAQARLDFNYRNTFFEANPTLIRGDIVVHHGIELQVLDHYPGLFTAHELNQVGMLRGIPRELNRELHSSGLNFEWRRFYETNPPGVATRRDFFRFMRILDSTYGMYFNPPVPKR
jgi:hypothetical protein